MLTRDITLEDAVLDLVDNCLDGVLRSAGTPDYGRHYVNIRADGSKFEIEDNCGGIERRIAIEIAFRLGRTKNDDREDTFDTIGMYGIGMKRAIFKMGRDTTVLTRHENDCFGVQISSAWLEDENWTQLPIIEIEDESVEVEGGASLKRLQAPGTSIRVRSLRAGIAERFASEDFINSLALGIGQHFALFLQRGFTITLNEAEVAPARVEVLLPQTRDCTPFFARDRVGDTEISVIVGINPRIWTHRSDEDIEPEDIRSETLPESGWSVFCNERAVLVGDKSRLTGWGIHHAAFHPQFSVITGMVHFRAPTATNLPVTTTKRSLDASSKTWLIAAKMMKEGMRAFMSYTTAWKNTGREAQQTYYAGARRATITDAEELVSFARSSYRGRPDSSYFNPAKENLLPKPARSATKNARIIFSRPKRQVSRLGDALFPDDDSWRPADVGAACFDLVYSQEEDDG